MRYSVIPKGLSVEEVERKCKQAGGRNVKVLRVMKQIFCDLEPERAEVLAKEHGLKVSSVHKVKSAQLLRIPTLEPPAVAATGVGLNLYNTYNSLRQAYSPPLLGTGLTVAVLDSGVRKTHEALEGKVVYEANFSDSAVTRDVFGHGTGTAYLVAGGYGEKSGVAPGAKIMSIKILNDNGEGTDEMLVDGIEEVCELVEAARNEGLPITDEMYPNTISLSIGAEDDGDPDNPMRVACRTAVEEFGVQVIAAAGNDGPNLSTILTPAVDPVVIAVGGLKTWEFIVWEHSSRGPSLEGLVKPDIVCWAENLEVAGHKSDDEYYEKTGTSFSTPTLAGVDGLIWELARRVYGETVRVTYYDWLPYAYAYCLKPEGVQIEKDNAYGYGIPAMGSMVSRLTRPAPTTIIESVLPMMIIMGIMPMIGGIGGA